jgi:hypothetical protein
MAKATTVRGCSMTRFRCSECGAERRLAAQYGDEIVSVYCLKHTGGVDGHLRLVYMTMVPESTPESLYLWRHAVGSRLTLRIAA